MTEKDFHWYQSSIATAKGEKRDELIREMIDLVYEDKLANIPTSGQSFEEINEGWIGQMYRKHLAKRYK